MPLRMSTVHTARNRRPRSKSPTLPAPCLLEPLEPRLLLDGDAEYLLITSDALRSAFQPLADRRAAQGLPAQVITVEHIDEHYDGTRPDGGSDLQTKIRNCIREYEQDHGTSWVTLGGDETVVPIRTCYGTVGDLPADLYYFDLDFTWDTDANGVYGERGQDEANLVPEVFGGRIPVRTAEQVTAYVDKLIRYETASPEGYANTMLLDASTAGPSYRSGTARADGYLDHERVSGGEQLAVDLYRNYVAPYWQATPLDRHCDSITSWDEAATGDAFDGAHFQDALNAGYHHVFVYGHGNAKRMPALNQGVAAELTNRDRPSIFFVISCGAGGYDRAEPGLSEALLRNPDGGAVAFIGANRTTYSSLVVYARQFYREVFENKRTTIGEAFALMKSAYPTGSWDAKFMWNLQGDSALVLLPEETQRDLHVSVPNGLELYDPDDSIQIRWGASGTEWGPDDRVMLEYSADSGATWLALPGAESLPWRDGLFTWEAPSLAAGDACRVRVTALSEPSVTDASDRDFSVDELALLTVQSSPVRVWITGTHGNYTDYNYTARIGGEVSLAAPHQDGMNFVRWEDGEGNVLTHSMDIRFPCTGDATLTAVYEPAGGPRDYYVNDDEAEEGFAAGSDENDGLSPQTPVRRIQEILDRYDDVATIRISAGAFPENVTIGASDAGIMIEGIGAQGTVIDGGGTGRCIEAVSAGTLSLRGIGLVNGSGQDGGGLYASHTDLSLDGVSIGSCDAGGRGGGLFAVGSAVDLIASELINCEADTGGGLYVREGAVTLEDCGLAECSARLYGGGAYLYLAPEVTLLDGRWTGNSAVRDAGGLYLDACGEVSLSGNEFLSNSADRDGGALLLRYLTGRASLSDDVFRSNTAGSDGGGVMAYQNPEVTVVRAFFESNEAGDTGGGVHLATTAEGMLEGCRFDSNQAAGGGGAYLGYDCGVVVNAATFVSNVATTGSAGGLFLDSNATTVKGCYFAENTALAGQGGAIHSSWAPAVLEGNVLVNNAASRGAAVCSWAANLTVVSNTIYSDPAHLSADPSVTLLYADYSGWSFCNNIVWGGAGFDCVAGSDADAVRASYCNFSDGYGAGADGNITALPSFVDPADPLGPDGEFGDANDGFRLAPDSPCVDSGNAAFQDADGTRSDMGAYGQALTADAPADVHVDASNGAGPWDGSAEHPYRRLWEALYAAAGATVHVAAGKYPEAVTIRRDGVRLVGQGAESTVVDAQRAGTVVQVYQAEDVEISDLTLTHGYGRYGGGVQAFRSSIDVHDCFIVDNKSMRIGGGVHVNNDSAAVIAGNRIEGNSFGPWVPRYGAGVYVGGGCEVDVVDNRIAGNLAPGSSSRGGGLCFLGTGTIARNVLEGNYSGGSGGGMHINGPSITVQDNVLVGNRAATGAGVRLDGGFAGEISHLTIAGNAATEQGGGVLINSAAATMHGCVVWGNTAPADEQIALGGNGAVAVRYSDVQGGEPGDGNLNADPLFVRPPDDGGDGWGVGDNDDYGDLHLTADSPCLNAGDPGRDCTGLCDVDGDPRGAYGCADVGADEFLLSGDATLDGHVDAMDYFALKTGLGTPSGASWSEADFTRDGAVDRADVLALAAGFGQSVSPSPAQDEAAPTRLLEGGEMAEPPAAVAQPSRRQAPIETAPVVLPIEETAGRLAVLAASNALLPETGPAGPAPLPVGPARGLERTGPSATKVLSAPPTGPMRRANLAFLETSASPFRPPDGRGSAERVCSLVDGEAALCGPGALGPVVDLEAALRARRRVGRPVGRPGHYFFRFLPRGAAGWPVRY